MNRRKSVTTEHLAFVSVRHGVYLAELFDSIVLAKKIGEATCASLKIEYRGTMERRAIFLITKDDHVVMQFRTSEEFLLKKNISFESWLNTDKIHKQILRQNRTPGRLHLIRDLGYGMKKVNLEVQILETPKPALVRTRYGNSATVCSVLVGDESGKVKLCLWNDQIKLVSKGNIIQIKNAWVSAFKGEMQVIIGKTGTICEMPERAKKAIQLEKEIA